MQLFEPIQPKEVEISGYKFLISLMPVTEGINVYAYFGSGFLPFLVGYPKLMKEVVMKLLNFVFVEKEGILKPVQLSSEALINAHIPPGRTDIIRDLVVEVWKHNSENFQKGPISLSFGDFAQKLKSKDLKTWIQLLVRLLEKIEHHSTNSEQSIR